MAFFCPQPSAPATPDYAAAATAQGAANKETAITQGYLNNPNIQGPLGGQNVYFDPTTNQPSIVQYLTPTAQNTLESQQRVQQKLAGLGETGLQKASGIIGTPFQYTGPQTTTSLANSGQIQGSPDLLGMGRASGGFTGDRAYGNVVGGTAQGNVQSGQAYGSVANPQASANFQGQQATGGVQGVDLQNSIGNIGKIDQNLNANNYLANNQLNLSNVAQMPVNAGTTGQAAIMSRLAPQLERQQKATAQNLANQGLVAGGEAYTNAMRDQSQQQNDLLTQAALQGISLDTAANQQGFNQALAAGQYGNTGTQQNFGNALAAQQAQNAAQGQGFNQQLQSGQFGNQAQLASFGANLQNQQAQNQAIAQNYQQGMGTQAAQNQAAAQNFGQNVANQQLGNQATQQNFNNALATQAAQNQAIGQNFGQNVTSQQLANAAIGQNYQQGMNTQAAQNQALLQNQNIASQQQQLNNAAQLQQYNQNLGAGQFANQAALQELQKQLTLRNQPLNEITGLMSGSQLQMPQFQGYNPTNIAPAPIFAGAQAQGAANMQNYGIQQSGANAATNGLFSLAGAALPMLSDRRLKSNIKRIGTHKLGIGLYEYDILGEHQQGVMADEVEKVMPEAVLMHPSGYKMVNYGLLG